MTGPAEQHPEGEPSPPATGDRPAKQHGDPLLAATRGETDGTHGSRHGADATGQVDERD